jgi:hypothetical protein
MTDAPSTWPDFAIGLYERLTGRGAAINYAFKDMTIEVPQGLGPDAPHATWKLNGSLIITTDEPKG